MPVTLRVFGEAPPGTECRPRRGAYAVFRDRDGRVAAVDDGGRRYLPGGGSLAHERPEETLAREVAEELGRAVRDAAPLCEAVQFFLSHNDRCWYRMHATVFTAELGEDLGRPHEFAIEWLAPAGPRPAFFYGCHEWAVALAARSA